MGSARSGEQGIDQDIEIRVIRGEDDEIEEWRRAGYHGFLSHLVPDEAGWRKRTFEPGRWLGAYDQKRCVGTFRSIPFELTVPGGAVLAADGIASVSVLATHRRRGLLSRMMERDLATAHARGDAVAILYPAEYPIYGRFGFGPATRNAGYEIGIPASGGLRAGVGVGVGAGGGGRIELATMEEVRKHGPELFDRFRVRQPGAISRATWYWQGETGEIARPGFDFKEPFCALYRAADGEVTGLLSYLVDQGSAAGAPDCTLKVLDHFATDRVAAEALWRYAFSVDWVRKVRVDGIAPDDPLPLLLNNPRAARPTEDCADAVWLKILDVPAAFGARTYRGPGRVVLEVADSGPGGYAAGRWAVEAAADGTGRATLTDDPADLAMDAGALGSLYLGGASAPLLAAAGLVRELRPGAAERADVLLRSSVAPWCQDHF
jgi:predicted acetyltransferase